MSDGRKLVRIWLERFFVGLVAAFSIYVTVNFVRNARESGRQDAIRAEIRAGQLDPEAGRGIMTDEEMQDLKAHPPNSGFQELRWFPNEGERPPDPERNRIEAAALAEVVKRTSAQLDRLEASAVQQDEVWKVIVWRLPKTPGGHYYLEMSKAGEVKEFVGGE